MHSAVVRSSATLRLTEQKRESYVGAASVLPIPTHAHAPRCRYEYGYRSKQWRSTTADGGANGLIDSNHNCTVFVVALHGFTENERSSFSGQGRARRLARAARLCVDKYFRTK